MHRPDILIRHEGIRLKPYQDTVGKTTIGIGRNLDDVGITKAEALALFRNDVARATAQCRNEFDWFDGLDAVRQDVFINLVFNMGVRGVKSFKKMLDHCQHGRWSQAAKELLDSKWREQVGDGRADELAYMLETGKFVSE